MKNSDIWNSKKKKYLFGGILENEVNDGDISNLYSSKADWGAQFKAPSSLQQFNGNGNGNPNGLTKKQEVMVRSAIKYWVERHKHVVR